jgi:hypothetical protein
MVVGGEGKAGDHVRSQQSSKEGEMAVLSFHGRRSMVDGDELSRNRRSGPRMLGWTRWVSDPEMAISGALPRH